MEISKRQQELMKQKAYERVKKISLKFQKDQLKAHADCYPEGALEALVEHSFDVGKQLEFIALGEHQDYQTLVRVLGVDFREDPRYKAELEYWFVPDKTRYGRAQSAVIWASQYISTGAGLESNKNLLHYWQQLKDAVPVCEWDLTGRLTPAMIDENIKKFSHPPKQSATTKLCSFQDLDDYNQVNLKRYGLQTRCAQVAWLIMSLHLGVGFAHDPLWPEFKTILERDDTEQNKIDQMLDVLIARFGCFVAKDEE